MILRDVALEKINLEADKFRMTFGEDLDALIASVKKVGVLNHPRLMESSEADDLIVICGYRRISVCRALGMTTVRAYIYRRGDIEDLNAFLMNLFDNLSTRDLNDMEKSMILRKLLFDFKVSREQVIREYLPLLKISPHGAMLEKYLRLAALEEVIKKSLVAGEIALPTAAKLSDLREVDRSAVFAVISRLKLGVNRQKEIIELLEESSRRDATPISHMLDDPEIQSLLTDERLPLAQRVERLQWLLRKRRFPQLSQMERLFEEKRRRLDLPEKVLLAHAPFFEENKLKIQFEFASAEELQEIAQHLHRLSQNPELINLFDLL